jgi:hypothetical protein
VPYGIGLPTRSEDFMISSVRFDSRGYTPLLHRQSYPLLLAASSIWAEEVTMPGLSAGNGLLKMPLGIPTIKGGPDVVLCSA